MYEKFFGLRERPFELTPNPKYLYLTARHREALSTLQYGISGRKGITLLLGEAGTGKTTIVRAALDALSTPAIECVYLSNPVLTREEFYEYLAPRLKLTGHASTSKAAFLSELESRLLVRYRAGGTTALIVDEAQSLPHELMEEVRLLANFETPDEKLLQVVLAGQPELAERLEHERLRQLKQRVALRCDLQPFDVRETAAYISGRIAIAGGQAARIFTREAVQLIHQHSRGIPRTISVICDNAMVTAFAAQATPIGAAIVLGVCEDFKLPAGGPASRESAAGPSPSVAMVVGDKPDHEKPAPGNGHQEVRNVVQPAPPVAKGASGAAYVARTVGVPKANAAAVDDSAGPEHRPAAMFDAFTKKKRFRFF